MSLAPRRKPSFRALFPGLSSLLLVALLLPSCEEERPEPTEPDGAFKLFLEAIAASDEEAVWEYLDQTTKDIFIDQYKLLVRIDKIISTYFDPSEHRYMRKRTGTYLLKEQNIQSGFDLYRFTFDASAIVFDLDHEVGADIDEMIFEDEAETIAQITTRSGQVFVMLREDDGVWRTASLLNYFEQALSPISSSEAAMLEFAKENLSDELERRKRVIQFAMQRALKAQKKAAAPAAAPVDPAAAPVDPAAPVAPGAAPTDPAAPGANPAAPSDAPVDPAPPAPASP